MWFDEKNRRFMRALLENLRRDQAQLTSNFSRQIIGGGFLYLHVFKEQVRFFAYSFLRRKKIR